jgi:hypothetical protein
MDDPGIVQKDEIAIVQLMRSGITRKSDLYIALLPDCLRRLRARN